MIATKIVGTLLMIAAGCIVSASWFPPDDVSRQLALVIMWYLLGIGTVFFWQSGP